MMMIIMMMIEERRRVKLAKHGMAHAATCNILGTKAKKRKEEARNKNFFLPHTLQSSSGDKSERDFHSNLFSYFYLMDIHIYSTELSRK